MGYVIKLDQGDYYESRGGYDWGRTDSHRATLFSDRAEAERIASGLRSFGARVIEAEE